MENISIIYVLKVVLLHNYIIIISITLHICKLIIINTMIIRVP